MPRVTFIYPCIGRFPGTKYIRTWQMQPLAIAILAALTPPEWERVFYDDRLEVIDYEQPTDLVAISIETFTARRGYQIADEYRKRGVTVVMGGYHATLCPDEALQHADAVCVGEAEGVWGDILRDVLHKKLARYYRAMPTTDLRGVTPDRSIFKDKDYLFITLVETGRGCRFRCEFCSITAFYKATYRHRSIEEVVNELCGLKKKLIFFVDDNIIGDIKSAKELFRAIKPLGVRWVSQGSLNAATDPELMKLMAESGCQGLLVGFESLSSTTLTAIGKPINREIDYSWAVRQFRKHEIMVYGSFMFGLPGDNVQQVHDTMKFAQKNKLWIGAFLHTVPFPGTPLYGRCRDEGRLIFECWWLSDVYRYGQVPFKPWGMTANALEELCYKARRRFFSWPSILGRGIDFSANCSSLIKLGIYAGTNLMLKRELYQRRGVPLGLIENEPKVGRSTYGKIAEPADDAGIRLLLRQTPMPGPIRLTYLREPSFLQALSIEGHFNQALIGIDRSTNQVIGVGCRSIKTAFINGQPMPLGYLSTLRIAESYRGSNYLARGYRLLREMHKDGHTKLYLMTIVEGNDKAHLLLTSGRAGLPIHHDFGCYQCMAISLKQKVKESPVCLDIRSAQVNDIASIIEFWQHEGSRKQFFPQYTVDDLLSDDGLLQGLHPGSILLAHAEGELVGTVAAWDQNEFRQIMVAGYSRQLTLLRPLYNIMAETLEYPVLPRVGTYLNYFNLSLVCIRNNNPQIFTALLAELMKRYSSNYDFFMAGFHESDPLLTVIKHYHHFAYLSRLYIVCYEDGEQDFTSLDSRVPYLELGAL
jgi:radical SAM superfamily enzyme YgiQ (UPF0313 family)